MTSPNDTTPPPAYLAGLSLAGRRVVVVGGGEVATRRVDALLDAGASLDLIAPEASDVLRGHAEAGHLTWFRRGFQPGDLDGAWYVQALTDDPMVNSLVAAEAERHRIFCVRGDDARGGTARTPASGRVGELMIGVVGERNPRRSARARDVAVDAVAAWESGAPER